MVELYLKRDFGPRTLAQGPSIVIVRILRGREKKFADGSLYHTPGLLYTRRCAARKFGPMTIVEPTHTIYLPGLRQAAGRYLNRILYRCVSSVIVVHLT